MKVHTVVVRVLKKPQPQEHSTSLLVHGDPPAVWRDLMEPETSLQTTPSVIAAGRWGAARGLGEVQCFMHRTADGSPALTADEVIEYEHERRAVTQGLTHGLSGGSETTMKPVGPGSVRISIRSWQTMPAGTSAVVAKRADRALKENVETAARGYARVFGSPGNVL